MKCNCTEHEKVYKHEDTYKCIHEMIVFVHLPYQPERSKREDRKLCDICCVNYKDINCECGALNSMET